MTVRRITHDGITLSLAGWARKLGVSETTLRTRINRYRMPLEKALVPGRVNAAPHGSRHRYEAHHCRCAACCAARKAHVAARRARARQARAEPAAR